MILSDLLRSDVVDASGARVGRVVDVRFRLEGAGDPSVARVVGLIVSPRTASSFLGYERAALGRPVILDRILRWVHRGSFLVPWADVARMNDQGVRLRPGYHQEPSALEDS
jgi:sporulation protein YlmC with PRC-barrel domain